MSSYDSWSPYRQFDDQRSLKETPLGTAVMNKDLSGVHQLLETRESRDSLDVLSGQTFAHLAATTAWPEGLAHLITPHNLNRPDKLGNTPTHCAIDAVIAHGEAGVQTLSVLLQAAQSEWRLLLSCRNFQGQTPLEKAQEAFKANPYPCLEQAIQLMQKQPPSPMSKVAEPVSLHHIKIEAILA